MSMESAGSGQQESGAAACSAVSPACCAVRLPAASQPVGPSSSSSCPRACPEAASAAAGRPCGAGGGIPVSTWGGALTPRRARRRPIKAWLMLLRTLQPLPPPLLLLLLGSPPERLGSSPLLLAAKWASAAALPSSAAITVGLRRPPGLVPCCCCWWCCTACVCAARPAAGKPAIAATIDITVRVSGLLGRRCPLALELAPERHWGRAGDGMLGSTHGGSPSPLPLMLLLAGGWCGDPPGSVARL